MIDLYTLYQTDEIDCTGSSTLDQTDEVDSTPWATEGESICTMDFINLIKCI
jgi:hypothetical protein